MKLARLFTSWKKIKKIQKSNIIKFRPNRFKSFKQKLESAKIEIEIKDELVTIFHNSHCSQSTHCSQSSHCSLNDLIQLATREMEESRQKQEDWEDTVYEEMNFRGRSDNENEYMDMNFRRL